MEHGRKVARVINIYSFSKWLNGHDAPDEGEGRDRVIKELHFQPLPFATVWSGELLWLSDLKKETGSSEVPILLSQVKIMQRYDSIASLETHLQGLLVDVLQANFIDNNHMVNTGTMAPIRSFIR